METAAVADFKVSCLAAKGTCTDKHTPTSMLGTNQLRHAVFIAFASVLLYTPYVSLSIIDI